MGRTLPSDPRSHRGSPLPPLPLRGCYLRFAPRQAVRHQAGSVGRDSGPGTLGEGKQQNLGGEGPYWASAWRDRRGGARPALLARSLRLATLTPVTLPGQPRRRGGALRHRPPHAPPTHLAPPPGPNRLQGRVWVPKVLPGRGWETENSFGGWWGGGLLAVGGPAVLAV